MKKDKSDKTDIFRNINILLIILKALLKHKKKKIKINKSKNAYK